MSQQIGVGGFIGKDLHCSQAIACLDMCRQRICRSGAQESSEARFTPLGNLPRSRVGWNGEASAIHSHQGLKMGSSYIFSVGSLRANREGKQKLGQGRSAPV